MWFVIVLCSFLALYMGLTRVLSADDGPYGWIIRAFEIGVPLVAAVALFGLSFQNIGHAATYQIAGGAFAFAAYNAALRKILPDVPFLAGGRDEASTVIVYMVLFAAGCFFASAAAFGFLPD